MYKFNYINKIIFTKENKYKKTKMNMKNIKNKINSVAQDILEGDREKRIFLARFFVPCRDTLTFTKKAPSTDHVAHLWNLKPFLEVG